MDHLPAHLLTYVVRPALASLGLPGGVGAEKLVMSTAAKESGGFDALRQIGGGPALSLWQIEPATAKDALVRGPVTALQAMRFMTAPGYSVVDQLPWNLMLGAALCRTIYYLKPFTLPADPTPQDLARIWKAHYNSVKGAGRVEEFIDWWERLNLGSLWK